MALSKLSRGKRISLKLLLAEEIEEEQLVMDMYGKKRAQTHYIFNLRSEEGMYNKLIVQHLREDPKKFSEFFRLFSDQFDFLVELVKDDLSKQSTNFRLYPITPEEKIAVTLRYVHNQILQLIYILILHIVMRRLQNLFNCFTYFFFPYCFTVTVTLHSL